MFMDSSNIYVLGIYDKEGQFKEMTTLSSDFDLVKNNIETLLNVLKDIDISTLNEVLDNFF